MKCNNCKSEWASYYEVSICPFCGEPLNTVQEAMDISLALTKIVDDFGEDVLNNPSRVIACVMDYVLENQKEKKLLRIAGDNKIFELMITARKSQNTEQQKAICEKAVTVLEGVKQDYKKAFNLFLESAYAGNYAAEFNVGLAYAEGQGVDQDPREAKRWFLLSAEKGFGKAMASLGIYAEQGIPDGNPDLEEAFDWYLKSANAGDYGFSQWIIGNCRTHGLMNSYVDKLEGFEWYLKAAYNDHPTAQNNVAVEYLNGILVDQDYGLAVEWFEKAVVQDEPVALNNYGTMLVNGNGVERDVSRGFEMIKRAAELGNHDAKVSLGVCYFEGWGTPRNLDSALKWLSESYSESGDESAKAYLEKGLVLTTRFSIKISY